MIKQFKKLFFTFIVPTFYGGGGGPTTSTVTQNSIPDWLQPQATALMGAATKQIFNTSTDALGNQQIDSIKPYQPYSKNASDYIAPFSPLQNQAFQGAANLQVPAQFGQASNMALNAQADYTKQATDPNAMKAWMSPYQQNVVDWQKAQANRDYDIQQTQNQAKAAQAGAYGGSRQQVQQDEAQRNLNFQLQGIEAQGAQNAYQNAQQQQQFAAGLGMQGAQLGGQLGGQQLSAEQGVLGTQSQYGQQQQTQQQNILNQAIQNYATAQQYPYQQLGFYNSLIHGLNTPTSASTTYQAPPSALSQLGGLAATGIGAYQALKAEGGLIKEAKMSHGGLTDLALYHALKDYKG